MGKQGGEGGGLRVMGVRRVFLNTSLLFISSIVVSIFCNREGDRGSFIDLTREKLWAKADFP